MNWNKLADELLGIVKATAPLVGLSEEVAAAETLLNHAKGAFDTIKDALDPGKREELEANLDALAIRVNAHAEVTKNALG